MRFVLYCFVVLGICSCELYGPVPECVTPTEISQLNYADKVYVERVTSYLKKSNPSDYRYFFKTFLEGDNQTMMLTNFRNDSTCFDVLILVEDWSKLGGMRKVNGKSYPKELRKLEWRITENNVIVYHDMGRIID